MQAEGGDWVKRFSLAWLLVAQGVTILPLFIYLPLWIPGIWLLSLIWRIQIFRGAWAFPANRVKTLLGLACIAGLIVSYAGTIGVEPLVAFLVIAFVLKLLEVRSRNDMLLIINVGFIAIAAQFLFFQTMFIAIYGALSVLLLLCAWNCIYRSEPVAISKQLKTALVLVGQSIPLMVILFLVMPRIGSLWHVPLPQKSGVTGFSDSMSPGDLSSLSQSSEIAFRVTFAQDSKATQPGRADWYWRALVLDQFDGRTWSFDDAPYFQRVLGFNGVPDYWQLEIAESANRIDYEVLMEPHQHTWLFTLMAPVSVSSSANKTYFAPNYLTKATKPIASRTQYSVSSVDNYRAAGDALRVYVKQKSLRLPENANPRARSLANEWLGQGLAPREMIEQALTMYTDAFTYTLQPPPLGTHSVDEFLFITRKGFCEHFASSFVFLMRAAGVPARVVVGYQGGELNPVENYVIVRQSDAHAWAEVWLKGEGWVRVDPTAAVSPLRIERGLQDSLAENEKALVKPMFRGAFFGAMLLRIDALSYSWHQWVLGYNKDRQTGLFKRLLGGTEAWRIGAVFVASVCFVLMLYFLFLTWKGVKEYAYPEQALYAKLLKKLNKKGYQPLVGESPAAFARRVGAENKAWEAQLLTIAGLFERVSYAGQAQFLNHLRKQIQALDLSKGTFKEPSA